MEKDIRVRRKRFWAFLLALVLVCSSVVPTNTEAASYTNSGEDSLIEGKILIVGDEIVAADDTGGCTITYYDRDGETILGKESITSSASHEVQAYTGSGLGSGEFYGWIVKTITVSSGNIADIILEPVGIYTIEYDPAGGNNAEGNPTEYIEGVGVTEFAGAEKTGYTFAGWYSDAEYNNKIESIPEDYSGKITLFAKFTPNTCSIIYELDGGENGAGNPDTYTVGVGVASLAPATKEGYTFAGWYRHAGNSVKIYTIGPDEVNDIRLYAMFDPNSYSITYDLSEGNNAAENPSTYEVGTGVESFGAASKEGYSFEGWYSDAEYKTKVETITTEQIGDIKLYAKFTLSETSSDDTAIAPDAEEDMSGTLEDAAVNLISESGVFSAKVGTGYCLGSGTWRVSGDSTSYSGGITFYVPTDGDYEVTLE